jgi:hypothetical protein
MKYRTIIEQDEDGNYTVQCPAYNATGTARAPMKDLSKDFSKDLSKELRVY